MYRLNKLIKLDRKLYHTNDLAIAWNISNKNTLYTTIKRYAQKGILIPIHKGLYSTIPLSQINPYELGVALIHNYTYLSTESVLAEKGIITQKIEYLTFISSTSKKISIGKNNFLYRKLSDLFLYNPVGIENQNGIFIASLERAVADLLYFNPKYHFDLSFKIDFNKVKELQKEMGYPC